LEKDLRLKAIRKTFALISCKCRNIFAVFDNLLATCFVRDYIFCSPYVVTVLLVTIRLLSVCRL